MSAWAATGRREQKTRREDHGKIASRHHVRLGCRGDLLQEGTHDFEKCHVGDWQVAQQLLHHHQTLVRIMFIYLGGTHEAVEKFCREQRTRKLFAGRGRAGAKSASSTMPEGIVLRATHTPGARVQGPRE